MPHRRSSRRPRLSQSPLAITSSGEVLVGLGYVADIHDLDGVIDLLRSGRITGSVFVGVEVTGKVKERVLRQLDDAAAEVASVSQAVRARRGQR